MGMGSIAQAYLMTGVTQNADPLELPGNVYLNR